MLVQKEDAGDNEMQYRPVGSYEKARQDLENCLGKRPTGGYMTFAQHSGFTNQIKAMLTALKFAHLLNRFKALKFFVRLNADYYMNWTE